MTYFMKIVTHSAVIFFLIYLAKVASHKLLLLLLLGLIGLYLLMVGPQKPLSFLANHRPKRYLLNNGTQDIISESTNQGKDLFQMDNIMNDILNIKSYSLLNKAVKYDPKGCARMLICRAASLGPRASKIEEYLLGVVQRNINEFRKKIPNDKGILEFLKAIQYGYLSNKPTRCFSIYNKCFYNLGQIWRFLSL